MNNMKWFFPESADESVHLFRQGFKPHGGGTFLIKTSLNVPGLFDLSLVNDFKNFEDDGTHLSIGSALSYHDSAVLLESASDGNFFSAALLSAASTPLRNRITVGGSIYALPKWSDIAAPLAAAEGLIVPADDDTPVGIYEYIDDRELKKSILISSIKLPKQNLNGSYYRFTLTGFDYPFFTIAASDRGRGVFRIAVSGTRSGIQIFSGSGDSMLSEAKSNLSFSDERGISGKYLKMRALIQLKRIIRAEE